MTNTQIKTQRLVLRQPRASDIQMIAQHLGDYEVAKMLARVPYPYDLETGRQRLQKIIEWWEKPSSAPELVFHVDHKGQMIGSVSFKALHETPEIGYWLGRPHWGQGMMSEAVAAAIDWLFQTTDHEMVLGTAMEENTNSLNVLTKCGFEAIGRSASMSLARGDYVPDIVMKLTRNAFTALKVA
ncbi:acetyltransferase [Roseibium sp. TrichSKD4]|uniref:GNAT family N-acetyltransferase n=1 Tax=Roseibium sp. TrichSKD4 TaxID=744980 RepID=UPI0001E561E7|nr:GNAT family N-acetyltransferase [Roseibium sp. TrichSKD4]EFO32951.1 acetyltransferase [Roseibium sp. TrichSKD4]